jgi:hypothetical protein
VCLRWHKWQPEIKAERLKRHSCIYKLKLLKSAPCPCIDDWVINLVLLSWKPYRIWIRNNEQFAASWGQQLRDCLINQIMYVSLAAAVYAKVDVFIDNRNARGTRGINLISTI